MQVFALGTFVDNLFISKVEPLLSCREDLEVHWLVDSPKCKEKQSKFTYPQRKRLHYEVVPNWLQKLFGRNLGKLIWAVICSYKSGYDVYLSYYIWPHGLMLFLLNLLHLGRLKTVHFLISGDDELKASHYSPSGIRHFRWCAGFVERCLLNILRSFSVVASKGTVSRQYLNQNGITHTIVFPGSIDTRRFSPRDAPKTIDIIAVARIDIRKNQETLLRSVPRLLQEFPSLQVFLVGKDAPAIESKNFSPMHGAMHKLVRELKLEDHVTFVEFTTDVEELYRKSKVYVQNSLSEGLSTSLREALACGLPAVATDVGDTLDVVGEQLGGILISDPTSQSELISAVSQLLRDADLRRSFGAQARNLIVTKHSIEYESRLFRDLFDSLLKGGSFGWHITTPMRQSDHNERQLRRKARIFFLIHKFIQGGAEQQLYELAKGINKEKFEVVVGCFVQGGEKWKDFTALTDVKIVCFNRKHKLDFLVWRRLLSFLRSNPVDILHAYLAPATFFGIMAGLVAHTPVLITGERGTKTAFATVGARVYYLLENLVSRYADMIIANSEAGRDWKTKLGVNPSRLVVIPNGLNSDRLRVHVQKAHADLGIKRQSLVIGNVARLAPMKDHVTLFRAIELVRREYKDVVCLIAGDGPLRPELEQQVHQMNLERTISFLGHQDHAADFIRLFDIAVLSSKYREGCSNFILEAMYCGKPVVATDVGGSRELIIEGVTGFVVEKESPNALASALLRLLTNQQLRQRMGSAGRLRVEREFMVQHMVRRTEEVYERLLLSKLPMTDRDKVLWGAVDHPCYSKRDSGSAKAKPF